MEYNNDHANYNYMSSFGYILSLLYQFTFIDGQNIKCVFVQKKTRNRLKKSRHDAIVNMNWPFRSCVWNWGEVQI